FVTRDFPIDRPRFIVGNQPLVIAIGSLSAEEEKPDVNRLDFATIRLAQESQMSHTIRDVVWVAQWQPIPDSGKLNIPPDDLPLPPRKVTHFDKPAALREIVDGAKWLSN